MAPRPVACLLVTHAALAGWISWTASPNKTEVAHMVASVYFWKTSRFDVFDVNPPFTREIAGLPVALCHPKVDWSCYSDRPQDRCEWPLGNAFLAANSPNKIRLFFAPGRWSLIPLVLLGGYFGFHLTRKLYGRQAGIVFVVLWCFSPLLLAWSGTICPDATAAALGLAATYTFRNWLHGPNWSRAAIAGACLGLLPLTKLTWIAAFGLWPLIWCAWVVPVYLTPRDKRSRPLPPLRQLAAILLLGLYELNMGYFFDGSFRAGQLRVH